VILRIAGVLDAPTLAAVQEAAGDAALYEDGRRTAGWHARAVKANLQARPQDDTVRGVLRKIEAALLGHEVFMAATRPKRLVRLLLSRYEPGMAYGRHVDDAVMEGVRTDLSFTLFLSQPDSYEGGALMIEDHWGERAVKLPAGAAVLYPSTSLHRVEPVTTGVRLAAVGWVRSLIRDPGRREILFDLENALRTLHAEQGKTALFDTLVKTRTNLLRLWADD
jgi:PKHD-type hydroxylase